MYLVWRHMIAEDRTDSWGTRALVIMEMNDNPVSVQVGVEGRRGRWDASSAQCKFPKAYEYAEVSMRMCDYGNIFRWLFQSFLNNLYVVCYLQILLKVYEYRVSAKCNQGQFTKWIGRFHIVCSGELLQICSFKILFNLC